MSKLFILVSLILVLAAGAYAQDESREVYESDLTVEVGVRLLFLDVEVVDADGQPRAGLTKNDFSIRLNNRSYPIESVDDLCGCGEKINPSPILFILFFDFTQLSPKGREIAFAEAERWIRDVKQPADRAMLVAHSTQTGLRRLRPLTDDAEQLLIALDDAAGNPELTDRFPADFPKRIEHCTSGSMSCHNSGILEYRQTAHSAKVLLHFLTRMDALPGRKALLLFYQNNAIYPGRLFSADRRGTTFYDGEPTDSVPNLEETIGEIAGTAVATGTVFYPLPSGPVQDWSVDFGETLANLTGGRLDAIDDAGRNCACMYRIGIDPPPASQSRVLRVKVAAGDESWLPHDYRLLQLTKADLWRRTAGAVLLDPESATDISLTAAILPVSTTTRRWDVKLQLAFDPRSLGLLPGKDGRVASWEVGAVLVRQGGHGGVEMLAVSRVRCPEAGCSTTVVHERVVEDLKPGVYEFRAFVHDRWTEAYGGARVALELPEPGRYSAVGPLLVAASGSYVSTDLPLWSRKPQESESPGVRLAAGVHPLEDGDESVTALTWVCDKKKTKKKKSDTPLVTGRWSLDGAPVAALEEATAEPIGHCWVVRDSVETSAAVPGRYDYEFRWKPVSGFAAPPLRASFDVAGIAPTEPAPPAVEVAEVEPEPPPVTTPVVPPPPSPEPPLQPSTIELDELLDALAKEASVYRDTALRFTCEETIVEAQRGRRRSLEFEYIYAYDDQGQLKDYRLTRRSSRKAGTGKTKTPMPVDLVEAGLRVFVLRAYSSIFIFDRQHQDLYDYEILGEEEALGRPAIKVRFEPLPPYVEDLNDWFGTAWVDRETYSLLRVRALEDEDHEMKRLFERGIVQERLPSYHRTRHFDEIDVEFGVLKAGIRLPSRVVLVRSLFDVAKEAEYLRTEAREGLRVVQSYGSYRIFGVRTEERTEGVVE